jgi:IS5 family transposase
MKISQNPTFAELAVARRKVKSQFFDQLNRLIDWRPISTLINKHYTKTLSASGRPAYDGLLLFKMSLLQTWYGLSDYEVEERLNDSISFGRFCGLPIDMAAPDHSTLSRFRSILTEKKAYDKILKALNKQLEKHKIIVKTGVILDASIIDSPLKPKGTVPYEIPNDRSEEEVSEENMNLEQQVKAMQKIHQPSVDTEASWIKKAGKVRYGFKKHVITDNNEGLILGVLTTTASLNEISNLGEVLETVELPEGTIVEGDKGYQSKKNNDILKAKKFKNRILKKAKKNKPLTKWELKFNKLVSQTRYKVERTFAGIKRWFSGGVARYKGMAKMHSQNVMEAMAYNLYRSPGIIMSKGLI